MQIVPVQDDFNQSLSVSLTNQNCQIDIYQNDFGLFMDVLVSGATVIQGVICQDRNRIVRDAYLGFIGDLCFMDTQGTSDPSSPGLGARYQLVYLDPFDIGSTEI